MWMIVWGSKLSHFRTSPFIKLMPLEYKWVVSRNLDRLNSDNCTILFVRWRQRKKGKIVCEEQMLISLTWYRSLDISTPVDNWAPNRCWKCMFGLPKPDPTSRNLKRRGEKIRSEILKSVLNGNRRCKETVIESNCENHTSISTCLYRRSPSIYWVTYQTTPSSFRHT